MFQHLVNFYPTHAQSAQFRWLNAILQCCLKYRALLCSLSVVTWGLGIWIFWNSADRADVGSAVLHLCAVSPTSLFSWDLGLWLYPCFLGGLRGRTCHNILVYNLLYLESRLWNLRDVSWFFAIHVKWQDRECWMPRREVIQRDQHLADGGRLEISSDEGLKGTSVLLLARPWSPHTTICSIRLLSSERLPVWCEVYTE